MKEYKVVIIGAGVAGLTAAIYLKRAGISCCILEGRIPGGQIIDNGTIENYPGFSKISGSDLTLAILKQIKSLEVPIFYQEVSSISLTKTCKKVLTPKNVFSCQNVIMATGRSPRKLALANEDKLLGKGLSYCAICDGSLYKDQEVLIVGGGDSAFEAASYLSNLASSVTLIHRRQEYRASQYLQDKVKSLSNVTYVTAQVVELLVTDGIFSGVVLDNGQRIVAKALFIYVGQLPNTALVAPFSITDAAGYISVDDTFATKIEGLYAIGDCVAKSTYQIITAMADAAVCALTISRRGNE